MIWFQRSWSSKRKSKTMTGLPKGELSTNSFPSLWGKTYLVRFTWVTWKSSSSKKSSFTSSGLLARYFRKSLCISSIVMPSTVSLAIGQNPACIPSKYNDARRVKGIRQPVRTQVMPFDGALRTKSVATSAWCVLKNGHGYSSNGSPLYPQFFQCERVVNMLVEPTLPKL